MNFEKKMTDINRFMRDKNVILIDNRLIIKHNKKLEDSLHSFKVKKLKISKNRLI